MSFNFRPAVRADSSLLIGIAGPSGSGKTFSALRLASGLAGDKPICMLDTESGRGLLYADRFSYQYAQLGAPFTPERYLEGIQAAHQHGAGCIIVDSMSHCHEGPGGVLELHEQILDRMAGQDFGRREQCKFSAWIEPKRRHNVMVNGILQVPCHFIFCFRAKDKLAMVKNSKGKREPVSMGWQPICTDRLEYEMTLGMILPPKSRGVPDLSASANKEQEDLSPMLQGGRPIDEELGRRFAEWSAGQANRVATTAATFSNPLDDALAAAQNGRAAFADWWNGPGRQHRAAVKPQMERIKAVVEQAEAAATVDEEDPFAAGVQEPPLAEPEPQGDQAQPAAVMPDIPPAMDQRETRSPEEWMKAAHKLIEDLQACKSKKAYEVFTASQRFVSTLAAMKDAGADQQAGAVIEAQEVVRREMEQADG